MNVWKLDYKDFLKGISTSNYVPDKGYSPLSDGFETTRRGNSFGLLTMGRSLTGYNTNIADSILAKTIYGNYYYSIGNAGKIYQTDLLTASHTVLAIESVKSYTSVSTDIMVYRGDLYITSDQNITKVTGITGSVDNDWWTTVAGGTILNNAPHKLFEFQGYMYITDGNLIRSWNGTTANNAELTLPDGWVISDVAIFNNQLYLAANFYSSNVTYNCVSKIFVWDSFTKTWIREIPLQTGKITAITSVDGYIYFAAGYGLYKCDGYNYVIIRSNIIDCDFKTFIGYQNIIYFRGIGNNVSDRVVYSYNTLTKSFNLVIKELGTAIDNIYTISIGYLDYLDITADRSTSHYFYRAQSNNKTGRFISNWLEPALTSRISKIESLFESPLSSSCNYKFTIQDENLQSIYEKDVSYTNEKEIIKWSDNVGNQIINACRLIIDFNHANDKAIRWLKIFYDRSESNKLK